MVQVLTGVIPVHALFAILPTCGQLFDEALATLVGLLVQLLSKLNLFGKRLDILNHSRKVLLGHNF